MKSSILWLKKHIPEGVASEEELKSLTAKSIRKGFSNWGARHAEAAVVAGTLETQDNSERID